MDLHHRILDYRSNKWDLDFAKESGLRPDSRSTLAKAE
ncbi:hypothetical protein AD43_4354 [Escherichia coli 3-105-05_S4_C3]|nr:hypothetical protein AD43_4354 [Escherichia coli 3-105-05_S4_C3]